MDLKKVFVIINEAQFTKHEVMKQLKEENYDFDFYFGRIGYQDFADLELAHAEEVWCFGECKDMKEFKMAKELGKDIWVMG